MRYAPPRERQGVTRACALLSMQRAKIPLGRTHSVIDCHRGNELCMPTDASPVSQEEAVAAHRYTPVVRMRTTSTRLSRSVEAGLICA